jgi:uncharacterized damage-inducible protein DinB
MPSNYEYIALPDAVIPQASPLLQHMVDTYASESNKVISLWRCFDAQDMSFRPHPRSPTVQEIMKHQLLSERRFFAEYLSLPEPPPSALLPEHHSPQDYWMRMQELAAPRLDFLARQSEAWWLEEVSFFDVVRQRIWIFWRRVLHTCHHRTQLGLYLRLLNKPVPSMYGPTADVSWTGADPTQTTGAAGRK